MNSDIQAEVRKAPISNPDKNKDTAEPKFTAPAGTNTNGKVTSRPSKCARIK